MDIEKEVFIQYKRLERHYHLSLKDKDKISVLDLAHALRTWVEMIEIIDSIANEKEIKFKFPNPQWDKKVQKILRRSKYLFTPLSEGVNSPNVKIKGFFSVNKVLSAEERTTLFMAGPPSSKTTSLSYGEWLNSGFFEVSTNNEIHPKIQISRKLLIKRVANLFGGSHPLDYDFDSKGENRFDPYIIELHKYLVANGYPLTYYLLLEIAETILDQIKLLFPQANNKLSISLLASKYEWECNNCHHINSEIKITSRVICTNCNIEFSVIHFHHQFE